MFNIKSQSVFIVSLIQFVNKRLNSIRLQFQLLITLRNQIAQFFCGNGFRTGKYQSLNDR